MQQHTLEVYTEASNSIDAKLGQVLQEVTGRRHIEGIHDAYIQKAILVQAERMRVAGLIPGAREIDGVCDLLVLIPTAYRAVLGRNGYKYLQGTLDSLRLQNRVSGSLAHLCALVVNMSPGEHHEFTTLQHKNLASEQGFDLDLIPVRCKICRAGSRRNGGVDLTPDGFCSAHCSARGLCGVGTRYTGIGTTDCTLWQEQLRRTPASTTSFTFRFIEQLNFEDPYPDTMQKGKEVSGYDDQIVSSMHLTRRQGLHLSHALLEASRWQANYIMMIEDDMPFCNASGFQSVAEAIAIAEKTSLQTSTDWSMIRVGYGGNGVIIHWKDAVSLGSYLIKGLNRRPIDWLMPEWATSKTFGARMINLNR